ncbi:N,N-dimethylformamidase beta subunit family domain-containing protein [Acuticoccus sediminis]|uniref:N,N-dimethylformamidase beta subunit family domain-containing protein n=1 Tax=Acuticoccus sediminis TaxID=2184697 RepID=UPI001CFCD6CF|nr:N,N-dimethylformamidase beta subunit family domain-containing protein [Acuticoccus sediminis]
MTKKPFQFPETGPHAIQPRRVRPGYADEHFLSDYRFQAPREDPEFAEVFVYTEKMSYDPGETVEFHGSCNAQSWTISIYRDGAAPEMMHEATGLPGEFTATSSTAYMDGCDWPVLTRWTIPEGTRSGFYRVVSTCLRKDGERFVQHHFFVVRPTAETQQGRLLVMLATGTWTAYNDWGGANHYFGTWGPEKNDGSPILSLKRPWTRGMLWLPKGAARITVDRWPDMGDAPRYPSKEWGYSGGWGQYYAAAGWAQFDRHFVVWAEAQGFKVDIITQTDLHYRPEILDRYTCLATSGHDEYWSWEMRKTVEDFVEKGGGFARFGGNYLWQIRLEEEGSRQVCWKFKAPTQDPYRDGPEKHKLTASWESREVAWPGASTVGVNGCHGMYASWGGFSPRGTRGFTVYRPEHWIFGGTNLRYADIFGHEAQIFGYEVDGLNYTFHQGLPYAVAEPGVPDNIEILAMSPAMLYEYEHQGPGLRYYLYDSDLVGLMGLAPEEGDEARKRYQHGSGMVVGMKRGRGEVITAGSCEWVMGLTRHDIFTETITRNVLDRFTAE